jgi:hypothetical protein
VGAFSGFAAAEGGKAGQSCRVLGDGLSGATVEGEGEGRSSRRVILIRRQASKASPNFAIEYSAMCHLPISGDRSDSGYDWDSSVEYA